MNGKKWTLYLLLALGISLARAQTPCTTLGQTPSTAFPVCGTDTFSQSTVPGCGGRRITAPGCQDFLTDINPFWYRFTCFQGGTLGFVITPNDPLDDYDWQLFDITNRNADDIYTDPNLFVACNWSGETGTTGASPAGNSLVVCASDGSGFRPLFSAMPTLITGHEYILMVSHFTVSSQSGYRLSFGGGTASITDPQDPALKSARAICDGVKMTVKLNKRMKCSSLNPDGSDFSITPAFAPIIAAEGVGCSNGFDMDSVILTLASPVPPGNYSITIKNDRNGINLLDNCDRTIPTGQNLPVTVFPMIPTPLDSLVPPACAPETLDLVFSRPMQCSTVAADGSDFAIQGPFPVTIAGAEGVNCSAEGTSNRIRVRLSTPIRNGGLYRLRIQPGSDGNTVLNECGMPTPVAQFIDFRTADTVNAQFSYQIRWGCTADTLIFTHDGRNGVNRWSWQFDNGIRSSARDTAIVYTQFGNKQATLLVSNGVCSDSFRNSNIVLDNFLEALFSHTPVVCPDEAAVFTDQSSNRITGWEWDFGNGNRSNQQTPLPQFYPAFNDNRIREIPLRLIVTNDIGCRDTASSTLRVVGNCYIAVPKAFTPNGDGLNDYLYPTNAYKARDLYFAVYNRNGNKLFETRDWLRNRWDGTYKGNPQDPGAYVWFLQYTHTDTGQRYELKGTTLLLR